MDAVGPVLLAVLAAKNPGTGLLVTSASVLAHELGHALVTASYHGGIRSWWVEAGPTPRLVMELGDGSWLEVRAEPPTGFVTVGPYPPGLAEEELRELVRAAEWGYAVNPSEVLSGLDYREADEAMAGPVVGALAAALLAPLDPDAAFGAALSNLENLLPEEVMGTLLDGWKGFFAVLQGRYPAERYAVEVGLALFAAGIAALENPRGALGRLLTEVGSTLLLAPSRLLVDVSKLLIAHVLGLEVRVRWPYVFPGVGAGINLSVVGPPWRREAIGPATVVFWLAVLPFVPQPWRGLLGLVLAMDALSDLDPAYPSIGSFVGELGSVVGAAFLVVGGLPLPLLLGLLGLS